MISTFETINWLLSLITSLGLVVVFKKRPYSIIRPVGIIVLFFNVLIQWAGTVKSDEIEQFLPDAVSWLILLHGFPLAGLFFLCFSFTDRYRKVWESANRYRKVWERLTSSKYEADSRAFWILLIMSALLIMTYLREVDLQSSGIYAMLTDPAGSSEAREEALKLLSNRFVVYAYLFFAQVVAPLLAVISMHLFLSAVRNREAWRAAMYLMVLPCLLVAVVLPGVRGLPSSLLLCMAVSWFLLKGGTMRLSTIMLVGLLILALPTVLTVLREGKELSADNLLSTFVEGILPRIFVTSMETGLYHVHYAQTQGFFGIAGIPKLAWLFGEPSQSVANVIGLLYFENPGESVSANTCFVFSFYSYFGLWSFPLSVGALFLLDTVIYAFERVKDFVLLPVVACLMVSGLSFTSSDYTIVLVSHGFLPLIFLALALSRMGASRSLHTKLTYAREEGSCPEVSHAR